MGKIGTVKKNQSLTYQWSWRKQRQWCWCDLIEKKQVLWHIRTMAICTMAGRSMRTSAISYRQLWYRLWDQTQTTGAIIEAQCLFRREQALPIPDKSFKHANRTFWLVARTLNWYERAAVLSTVVCTQAYIGHETALEYAMPMLKRISRSTGSIQPMLWVHQSKLTVSSSCPCSGYASVTKS